MAANSSSLAPPTSAVAPPPANGSHYPPAAAWDPPSFGRAAQVRVGATALLFLFAAGSNLALLGSVWRGRGRRLASHLRPLMLSLAAADLMMTFVVMPLDAVWNVTVQWYAGSALCKLLSFLKLFAMHAAALVLVVISLDRQHAILHPLDALSAHRRNRVMLLLAWGLSLLLASPQLFLFRTISLDSADFTQCASHGSFGRHWQETAYNMFTFTTLYVVPLLVMSCCYSRILLHIHRQHLRNKAGESRLRRSGTDVIPKARLKTLRMSVVIVLSFVVCWTPYYLLGLWYWFQPAVLSRTPDYVHHALFVFGNLNTCCDPLIYGFYTPSFRADLSACLRRASRRDPGPDRDQSRTRTRNRSPNGAPVQHQDRSPDTVRSLDRTPDRHPDPDRTPNRDQDPNRTPVQHPDQDRTPDRTPDQDRTPDRHLDRAPDPDRAQEHSPDRYPDLEPTPDPGPVPRPGLVSGPGLAPGPGLVSGPGLAPS